MAPVHIKMVDTFESKLFVLSKIRIETYKYHIQ